MISLCDYKIYHISKILYTLYINTLKYPLCVRGFGLMVQSRPRKQTARFRVQQRPVTLIFYWQDRAPDVTCGLFPSGRVGGRVFETHAQWAGGRRFRIFQWAGWVVLRTARPLCLVPVEALLYGKRLQTHTRA